MQYDMTTITMAGRQSARPLPPDVRELREHLGEREPRLLQLRRTLSAGLYRLAARVAPRPVRGEHDELFDAISALLAEPNCETSMLKTTSHGRC